MRSKMRHWCRCERRFEMAFIIGPVAPTAISNAPVLSVSRADFSQFAITYSRFELYPTILQYFICFNAQKTSLEHAFCQYVVLLPAHTHAMCAAPLCGLRNARR